MHGSMHGDGVINQTKRSSPSRKALVEPDTGHDISSTTPLASTRTSQFRHDPGSAREAWRSQIVRRGGLGGGLGGGWGGLAPRRME